MCFVDLESGEAETVSANQVALALKSIRAKARRRHKKFLAIFIFQLLQHQHSTTRFMMCRPAGNIAPDSMLSTFPYLIISSAPFSELHSQAATSCRIFWILK